MDAFSVGNFYALVLYYVAAATIRELALKNSQLTYCNVTIICEAAH
jgi:hypothetical protein